MNLIKNEAPTLFDLIPEYPKIISDLSRGNLKADFESSNRKSKLCHSLDELLLGENNDELPYFILYMDSKDASNLVKFLLDLNNFEKAFRKIKSNAINSCTKCKSLNEKRLTSENECPCLNNHDQIVAQDALSIFSKYITTDAKYSINAPKDIVNEVIGFICPENGTKVDSQCFNIAKIFVFNQIKKDYYDKYINSEYHCKYLLNILDNKRLKLADLLYDDIAVVYLLEYLEQEGRSELLKFWIQAENFSRNILSFNNKTSRLSQINTSSTDLFNEWQSDAIVIYDNFISLQAKSCLGFDLHVRRQVELNICQNFELDKESLEFAINSYSNCFYVPLLIVYSILEKCYFEPFLSSALYKKYMNEIKFSFKTTNEPIVRPSKVGLKKVDEVRNKDEAPLWLRSQAGNLQIGKIDSNGRYVSLLSEVKKEYSEDSGFKELDDAWDLDEKIENFNVETNNFEQRIKKKLGKLMSKIPLNGIGSNYGKSSMEEQEMAERVAAMLVKDVIAANKII